MVKLTPSPWLVRDVYWLQPGRQSDHHPVWLHQWDSDEPPRGYERNCLATSPEISVYREWGCYQAWWQNSWPTFIFLSKRARPDLQTTISFLYTRITTPDVNDYKKLASVMKYLHIYPHLPRILGSDGEGNIYWSVDAAFAVHNDTRGHTGAHMTLGQGTVVSISTK